MLNSRIPPGPLSQKWSHFKEHCRLVSPNNKKKHPMLVVGTGLAGASAAATLAELGYPVKSFCIQDSPRRAHSIAAQGGINATKNYPGDGDSIWRLFYDTIKGGDYRSREANVYRLAEISGNIIDQCVAQGVPLRGSTGWLGQPFLWRSPGVPHLLCQGQTGQQLLLGAYSALMRMVNAGQVEVFARREMLDLVVVNGQARGIIVRNLVTENWSATLAMRCCSGTGGYGNVYYLSTNAKNSNVYRRLALP
jgi:succinate dehydrogenase / fumarate reductase flavoprotein subunit